VTQTELPPLEPVRPALNPDGTVPSLGSLVGRALSMVGTYNDLDNKQQVRSAGC
jgi:hypothetical protein